MVTVEFLDYDTVITVLDNTGECGDLEAILDHEGYIWIRQFCEESETVDLVRVTLQQFSALVKALGLPEGTYMMEYKNEL